MTPARRVARCAARIARRIGGDRVVDDPSLLEKYGGDESGEPARAPSAAVLPRTTTEVSRVLALCAEEGVPATPRGGGTGKSGGAIPARGGIVVATDRLGGVEEIDAADFVVVTRPGVVLEKLQAAVEERGLFYPPDPASLDSCFIGGNVAENAGGPRAFKYGVTARYVLELETVTMGGRIVRAGCRALKQAAGYNLPALLAGSEGTLGLFTRVTLRCLPLPEETATLVAVFGSHAGAAAAIGGVLAAGVVPRVMELMDAPCLAVMRELGKAGFGEGAGAALLVEFDGTPGEVRRDVERAGATLDGKGAVEVLLLGGAAERNRAWDARRKLSEHLAQAYEFKASDDVSVPRGRIAEAIEEVYRAASRRGLVGAVYGHAGDGNLHVNVLSHEEPAPGAIDAARDDIVRAAVRLGGAISGEHGVGTAKRRFMPLQHDRAALRLLRQVKRAFDPKGLMNPGKILP